MKKIIIAILCALLAGLCACEPTEPPETTTTAAQTTIATTESATETTSEEFAIYAGIVQDYLEEYNELLNEENRFMDPHYYFLYDIDGNGTKELLMGENIRDKETTISNIYTVQNGEAVLQEETKFWMDFNPSILLFKNGTIRYCGTDEEGEGFGYYRFKKGELKRLIGLLDEYGNYFTSSGSLETYKKTPITKQEFDRVQKEMEGDGQTVELDWKPLAEYGR